MTMGVASNRQEEAMPPLGFCKIREGKRRGEVKEG